MITLDEAAEQYDKMYNTAIELRKKSKIKLNGNRIGFKTGYDYAMRWIPIGEDLPIDEKPVFTKSNKYKSVDYSVSVYHKNTKKMDYR